MRRCLTVCVYHYSYVCVSPQLEGCSSSKTVDTEGAVCVTPLRPRLQAAAAALRGYTVYRLWITLANGKSYNLVAMVASINYRVRRHMEVE